MQNHWIFEINNFRTLHQLFKYFIVTSIFNFICWSRFGPEFFPGNFRYFFDFRKFPMISNLLFGVLQKCIISPLNCIKIVQFCKTTKFPKKFEIANFSNFENFSFAKTNYLHTIFWEDSAFLQNHENFVVSKNIAINFENFIFRILHKFSKSSANSAKTHYLPSKLYGDDTFLQNY